MTTTAMRERLYNMIKDADDIQIEAIYLIVKERAAVRHEWSADTEFVAELDERVKRLKAGIDKGVSLEEFETSIELRRAQRACI